MSDLLPTFAGLLFLVAIHVPIGYWWVVKPSRPRSSWRVGGLLLTGLSLLLSIWAAISGPYDAPQAFLDTLTTVGSIWVIIVVLAALATTVVGGVRAVVARRRVTTSVPPRTAPINRPDTTSRVPRRTILASLAGMLGLETLGVVSAMTPPTPPNFPPNEGVIGRLPFRGRWLARNSPARRVPSHGTTLLGVTYAIDFIAVDDLGRTAPTRDWRAYLATEPPEIFYAYGQPVLSPVDGTVVALHDGEIDHEARRSQLALLPYMLSQGSRLREGVGAIAGNYIIISPHGSDYYVGIVHLQRGSLRVKPGDAVRVGQQLASCGNTGNSTQPHIHIQAMDSLDLKQARGVPLLFDQFEQWEPGARTSRVIEKSVPSENCIAAPC